MFPLSYNYKIYKLKNIDLILLDNEQLYNHYLNFGINEGRICNEIESRQDITKFISNDFKCLEIGPFDCPVIKGENVKYFDVLNKEELIERAKSINRTSQINNIPFIHYHNNNANLKIINDKFNLILSCHSIEHQINFIKHLNDVSELLLPNGCYVIICPDKRYCFDHFIKESTIADIFNMNNNDSRHSLKSIIEHRVLVTHNDTIRHWQYDHGIQRINNHEYDYLLKYAIDEFNNTNEYIDVHSLQFTPSSFEKIIEILFKNNFINMSIDKLYHTKKNQNEFIAILKKN